MADSKDSKPPKKPLDPKHSEELERTGKTGETPSSGASGGRSEGSSRGARSRDSKKSTAPSQTEKSSELTPSSSSIETSASSKSFRLKLKPKTPPKPKTPVASGSSADKDPGEIPRQKKSPRVKMGKVFGAVAALDPRKLKPRSREEDSVDLTENMASSPETLPQAAEKLQEPQPEWKPIMDPAVTGQVEEKNLRDVTTPPSSFSDTATETTSLTSSISLGSRIDFPSEVASCADSREGSTRDLSCPERELERRSSTPMKTGQKRTEIPLEEGDYKEFDDSPCKRPQLQDPDSPGESPKDSEMTE